MEYGYARVSTKDQNLDRQLIELQELGISKKKIFIDKQSGKDFCRINYQKLKNKLKQNDLLIIKSIDRLGRNYEGIIEEWAYITKTIGANIFIIDMPILDTRSDAKNLVGKFISDIVLQVLSFVAENERTNIKQRQAEGIKIAQQKGIVFGRPKTILPSNFNNIKNLFINKKINLDEALALTNLKRSTFYKYINTIKEN